MKIQIEQLNKYNNTAFFLVLMLVCSSCSHANTQQRENSIHISSLVNKQALECQFLSNSKDIMDFYNHIYRTPIDSFNRLNNLLTLISSEEIKGVTNFSKSIKTIHVDETEARISTKNLDFNLFKYDVDFLRVSSFMINGKTGEGPGYYFILKGHPEYNISKLNDNNINIYDGMFETTAYGNTRIWCYL